MAVTIHSGDLKHKIALKEPTVTKNDEGGQEFSYPSNTIVTFAAIKSIRRYRTSEAEATAIIGIKEFFIRWTKGREAINKNWLLVWDAKEYVIHEVDPDDKKFIRIAARTKE